MDTASSISERKINNGYKSKRRNMVANAAGYAARKLRNAAGRTFNAARNTVKQYTTRRVQQTIEPLQVLPESNASVIPPIEDVEKKLVTKYKNALDKLVIKDTSLVDLMRPLMKNSELLITQCQAMGGFYVNNDIKVDIDKIYERLGKISSQNLVALTEAGDSDVEQKETMIEGINRGMENISNTDAIIANSMSGFNTIPFKKNPKINMDNQILCRVEKNGKLRFDDTAFIFKNFIKYTVNNATDKYLDKELDFKGTKTLDFKGTKTLRKYIPDNNTKFSNLKYIESNGIKILNVHLPSDGPEKLDNIETFLTTVLSNKEELNDDVPNIIVGDTNITCSKCKIAITLKNRCRIMQEMVYSVKKIYKDDTNWAILMSTIYVNKFRSYGILLNQQPTKTNKRTIEPDGSVIFIKMDGTLPAQMDETNFGKNWILLCNNTFYTDVDIYKPKIIEFNSEISESDEKKLKIDEKSNDEIESTIVDFLKFDKENINECLDTSTGMLLDTLFIDHTPVQISFGAIKDMTGITQPTQRWQNLIVLNAGSITNSIPSKNWDLTKLKCMKEIKLIDKDLYDGMIGQMGFNTTFTPTIINGKKIILNGNSGEYENIKGDYYGNWMVTNTMNEQGITIDNLASLFAKAEFELSKLICFPPVSNSKSSTQSTSGAASGPHSPKIILGGRYIKKVKEKVKVKLKVRE